MKTPPAGPNHNTVMLKVVSAPKTAGETGALAGVQAAPPASTPDFTQMTKADYVAWGKSQFAKGQITLDDLFQVQYAGGDFDGTVQTDTAKHDFVAFFDGLVRNEIAAGRDKDPKSMVPAYRHVLAAMSARFSRTV